MNLSTAETTPQTKREKKEKIKNNGAYFKKQELINSTCGPR